MDELFTISKDVFDIICAETTKLKERNEKLEKVREAAADVYESIDFNITGKSHMNMWAVEQLIQAMKNCEDGDV